MRKRILILVALLLALLLTFVIVRHIQRERKNGPLVLFGNVDVRLVDIGFRVPGQVKDLRFEEGDFVKAGTLMASLDRSPYSAQVKQAEAQVESTKATLENAEILLKRRQELIGLEGVSQENLDDATSSRNVAKANLAAAEAALEVAQDNLKYTEAYSPTDGIILTRVREPGSVLNANVPVYTLSVTSPVWIRAFVSEPDLGRVCYGMEATISTDTEGAPVFVGRVGFISPIAEFTPKTVQTTELRTDLVYRLRIYVDNPNCYLKQGMPVTVTFKESAREESR